MPIARFDVLVAPRAAADAIAGWRGGVLLVRLTAPPTHGRANSAPVRLLAHRVGRPVGAVVIVGGLAARRKQIELRGIDAQSARMLLGG